MSQFAGSVFKRLYLNNKFPFLLWQGPGETMGNETIELIVESLFVGKRCPLKLLEGSIEVRNVQYVHGNNIQTDPVRKLHGIRWKRKIL